MSDLELLANTMQEWSSTSGDHHMQAAAAIRELIKLQAQAGDGEPEAAQDRVIAGALFDFLGFLTTRDKPTSFGATRNASPAVKLLQEWANKRGLDLDGADVEGWRHGAKGE